MERQGRIAAASDGDPPFLAMKRAAARFYLDQIVPEAIGLKAAATASADVLYAIDEDAFADQPCRRERGHICSRSGRAATTSSS